MGKLYKRGDTYYADYYDRDGRRHRESTRTGDPKVARERLRDMELATTDRRAHQTEAVAEAVDYFVNVACAGKSDGTVKCYRQKGRHLARRIGDELLDRLTLETVQRYIAGRLEEGAHRHSVHKELVVLRGALASAKPRDRFHGSMEVVPEFESGYVPRTTYLTPDQFLALVPHLVPPAPAKAKERTVARRELRAQRRALYCLLIAFASPRRGEVEGILWEHVDLGRGVVRVPKGKTVSRVVTIHPVLKPWLEGFGELAGWTGPIVERWSNVGRDLPAACKRANAAALAAAELAGTEPPAPMPEVTPNDLRRTFASWLIQAGVSNRIVARLLGHSTTRMVDLVYGQLDDATLAAAIMRLPSCDAGVSNDPSQLALGGTTSHGPQPLAVVNSVENAVTSTEKFVPRVGIEPTTRGFSGLRDLAPKVARAQQKLRAI